MLYCTDITTPTIDQLTEELAGMSDWYSLGVALLVPVSKLQEIMASSLQGGIARWRIDLLQYWLDSTPTASWSDIITALEKIGHHTLSTGLRSKYLPSATTTTTGMRIHKSYYQFKSFVWNYSSIEWSVLYRASSTVTSMHCCYVAVGFPCIFIIFMPRWAEPRRHTVVVACVCVCLCVCVCVCLSRAFLCNG